ALGYLGGALAVIAVLILAEEFWADLELWGRLALLGIVTLGLLIAGWVLRDSPLEAVRRLAGFLWLFAAVGVAFTFGILSADGFDSSPEGAALVGSLAAIVFGFVLWRLRTESLQQLALFAAIVATLISMVGVFEWPDEMWGLSMWAAGTAWLFLTWGMVIRPETTGYALGSVAALFGVQMLAFEGDGWPLLLGVVLAGALIVTSVTLRQIVLLALGAAGVFIFVPQVVFHFFGDSLGAPVALLLSGAALIGGAVALARLMGEIKEDIEEEAAS
ncbi:MAG: hypothetical protein KJN63_06250, partial [Acidimicrobiia bacterium]|nr:hypothetical protein [Acidimicrobiia bacterium]